jgi:two-component system OmpR family response regulator/two-component system response regulator QseB
MRLLLAEDDTILGSSLKSALETQGYGVDWAKDGESALASARDALYDILILDINLPKLPGLDVLKTLRRTDRDISILVLTARDTPAQRIEGLDSGADDYMVKPFDLGELFARLRSLRRRDGARAKEPLRSGDVELDAAGMAVRRAGEMLAMTAKELRVLRLLMERAGNYVTKADIETALYSPDKPTESNTVEVTIYALRKKLGAEFIHTIRGVGYMVRP